jgi:hypothetical protein
VILHPRAGCYGYFRLELGFIVVLDMGMETVQQRLSLIPCTIDGSPSVEDDDAAALSSSRSVGTPAQDHESSQERETSPNINKVNKTDGESKRVDKKTRIGFC